MDEFAKMIYEQWFHSDEAQDYTWGREYDDAWKKVYEILNPKMANEIESSINRCVFDVQEKSFIAGFAYACKCLSNGKIEFGGGMKNE